MPFIRRLPAAVFCLVFLASFFTRPAQALNLCSGSCSCTVGVTAVMMSGYNPINSLPITGTGSVTVSCQLLLSLGAVLQPYTIALTAGQSGNFTTRQMSGPSSTMLNYNLYSDPGMVVVWGDGTGSSQTLGGSVTLATLSLPVVQTSTVYARIPASQNVPLGTYNDSVTATLSF